MNNAARAVGDLRENRGRLGVFWHTQGSGKSYSMIFFAQKVLRKLPGNWTFLVVTDRLELDEQIYKNFAGAGVITEQHIQAESGEHLKLLLREDHRYIFTLIQKFHTKNGEAYGIAAAVAAVHANDAAVGLLIEVEVKDLDELREAIALGFHTPCHRNKGAR